MESLAATIVISLVALAAVVLSAEIAVQKILKLVRHYGFSDGFAGLTIFSVATSFPEIFAHLVASIGILSGNLDYKIASGTVLGANIGSDVIQQTLVLGIVVLFSTGFYFSKKFLYSAYLPMIGTTLMTLVLGWDRTLSRLDGLILLGTFVVYMRYLYSLEKRKSKKHSKEKANVSYDIVVSLIALSTLLVSAHFLLKGAEKLVIATGLGGSLIGVVSLGVAAAAPEFFTAMAGIRQKSVGVSLGTLIGSNITNPLVAIGGGALISTYWVPRPLLLWDLPMETITASLLFVYLLKNKGKLSKGGGWYLIGLYIVYLGIRIWLFSID